MGLDAILLHGGYSSGETRLLWQLIDRSGWLNKLQRVFIKDGSRPDLSLPSLALDCLIGRCRCIFIWNIKGKRLPLGSFESPILCILAVIWIYLRCYYAQSSTLCSFSSLLKWFVHSDCFLRLSGGAKRQLTDTCSHIVSEDFLARLESVVVVVEGIMRDESKRALRVPLLLTSR